MTQSWPVGARCPKTAASRDIGMSLRHSMRQESAQRCQKLLRVVRESVRGAFDRVLFIRVPALDQAYINAMALGGKLNDFPSSAIRSSEYSEICRLSGNLEARLTVKFRNRTPRKILPSDLPSKRCAWGR
jgi:hypothetical protein